MDRRTLAKKVTGKPTVERVKQWEQTGTLTFAQVRKLAHATHTPEGFLYLKEPPDDRLPIPDFRTVGDESVKLPSPDLLDTVYMMQRRQTWMRDSLIEEAQPRLRFVGSATLNSNPQKVASEMRKTLGVASGWANEESTWTDALMHLRQRIEAAGILIVINGVVGNNNHRKLDPNEFRGFVLSDVYAPLVFINGADFKAAQMFAVAHEVAHLWIKRGETRSSALNSGKRHPRVWSAVTNPGIRFVNKAVTMNLISRSFLTRTLILGLLLTLTPALHSQQRSREEVLREAGRLVTEAERKKGEVYKKVQAGADRKLMFEADKQIAESLEKAIELWREVHHDNRLRAGVEELTRIYSVLGEYDRVLDRLTREAEYWRERGDVAAQAETLYTLGIRQWQMKRETASMETLQQVLAMSRSAGLRSLERNVLTQLASLYEKAGQLKEAESSRQSAKELRAIESTTLTRMPEGIPPATLPAQWVDLPGAPAAAEYRVIAGVSEAVLVNRSSKGIEMVSFGCVALEDNKKVRVLYGLGGMGLNHGGVQPSSYYQPFRLMNGPLSRWTDEKMACEGAAKMTLIEARFDDGSSWKADGINWVP